MGIQTEQLLIRNSGDVKPTPTMNNPDLVLAFGPSCLLRQVPQIVSSCFPLSKPVVCGCTTSGQIADTEIVDDELVLTLVRFEKTRVKASAVTLSQKGADSEVGVRLAEQLKGEGLVHVLVLSEGLNVNGSALLEGIQKCLPSHVSISGGLAGDGTNFSKTELLFCEEVCADQVVGIGFYGNQIRVSSAALGGWDPFGPLRTITRSDGNILYELDGRPALDIYKEYLGSYAKDLPASGLLFPLTVNLAGRSEPLVRTILGIDEDQKSLTFAGNVPEGCTARLMKANIERLVDGAADAASAAAVTLDSTVCEFAILISCVGRRLVLKQRAEEELEAAKDHLGANVTMSGFYSYGEISPFVKNARCELHNQTMTITAFTEV